MNYCMQCHFCTLLPASILHEKWILHSNLLCSKPLNGGLLAHRAIS